MPYMWVKALKGDLIQGILWTHTHTHAGLIALPGPLKWLIIIVPFYQSSVIGDNVQSKL